MNRNHTQQEVMKLLDIDTTQYEHLTKSFKPNIIFSALNNTMHSVQESWSTEKKRVYFKDCLKFYMRRVSNAQPEGTSINPERFKELKAKLDEETKHLRH